MSVINARPIVSLRAPNTARRTRLPEPSAPTSICASKMPRVGADAHARRHPERRRARGCARRFRLPRRVAARASIASNRSRRMTVHSTSPPRDKSTSPTGVAASPRITSTAGTSSGIPSSSSASMVLGISPPAQTLNRGCADFSIATIRPASAGRCFTRYSAVASPAGPAPAITHVEFSRGFHRTHQRLASGARERCAARRIEVSMRRGFDWRTTYFAISDQPCACARPA